MTMRMSRRTFTAGAGALAASAALGRPPTARAQEAPVGHLVAVPLIPESGRPDSGLLVVDMATGTESRIAFAGDVEQLLPVAGTPSVLYRNGANVNVHDASTDIGFKIAAKTRATSEAELLVAVFLAEDASPLRTPSRRWLTIPNIAGPAFGNPFLVDLEGASVTDLGREIAGEGATVGTLAVIPGTDLVLMDLDNRLLVLDPATGGTVAVVATAHQLWDAALSPSGRRVSWRWQEADEAPYRFSLADVPTQAGWATAPTEVPSSFTWVDDGRGLVTRDTTAGGETTLSRLDLATGETEPILTRRGELDVVVLAHGTRALVRTEYDNVLTDVLVDLADLRVVALGSDGRLPLGSVEWSTRVVVFDEVVPDVGQRVSVLNAATGAIETLLQDPPGAAFGTPLLAPGGRHAAVATYPAADITFLCDLAAVTAVRLDGATPLAFSPDGRHLLTQRVEPATGEPTDVELRALDGTILRTLGRCGQVAWVE